MHERRAAEKLASEVRWAALYRHLRLAHTMVVHKKAGAVDPRTLLSVVETLELDLRARVNGFSTVLP